MTTEQWEAAAHQQTQENGRDKGMMTNSQKGATWSENDNSSGMGKTYTSPTRTSPERHKSEGRNNSIHKTTGGNPPREDLREKEENKDGKTEEKSTGAPEKNAGSPEGWSWADHTRVLMSTVGKRLWKITSPPRNKLCLLDPLRRNNRADKDQGKYPMQSNIEGYKRKSKVN